MENERKKVKFCLIKFTKKGSFKFVGYGEIDNENLYTKNGTTYKAIKVADKIYIPNNS